MTRSVPAPTDEPLDDGLARLLEAHVRFEVDRWRGEAVRATVAAEIAAVLDPLEALPVRALVPPERASAWLRAAVAEAPVTGELVDEIEWVVRAAHQSLLEEAGSLAEVLPSDRYDQVVATVIGLGPVRGEVVDQLTASAVYARLISHVLYHGLKGYLLTENGVARHVPGASSLLRMGQNAVRSATPNLEAGIDRRLLAFVASNVAETIRDSREFLDGVLDDDTLRTVAAEIWSVNGRRAVGELAELVEDASITDAVAAGRDIWRAVRASPVVARVIDAIVEQFYRAHGDEPVAVVLADFGVTRERALDVLAPLATQLAEVALAGGQLEAYARRRLEAFYRTCRTGP